MKKKILSILCVVAMLIAMLPSATFAATQTLGTLIPLQDFQGFETGAGMPASKGNDFLRNNSTSGAVYIAKEDNGNQYLYAANANTDGCDIVYYSSSYTLAAQSSLEMKISLKTTDALNAIHFYLKGGSISSYRFLSIENAAVKVKNQGSSIPVSGYSWTPNAWHDITFRWNYATGYTDIVIECGNNVYKGSVQDSGFSIGSNTATGIEIYATNVLNIDNLSLTNITAPFPAKTFIDDDFEDLTTTGWTDHANGNLSAVQYDGRKCLRAEITTSTYYEPKYDCDDFTASMGNLYLQTDFKLANPGKGFDIRFRDGNQKKMFGVDGTGKTEVPNCGNMYVEAGADASWYTLKIIYNFTTKNAYINISNEDGVSFTAYGSPGTAPSQLAALELIIWEGAVVYFDNILVKNIEDEVPAAGFSRYFSFNDLANGDVVGAADKADGTSAYYGWYHTGEGTVTAESKDGKAVIALQAADDGEVLVCEKFAITGDTIETDFMLENLEGTASIQVAGSAKEYANAISVAGGKIIAGSTELCDFVPGAWYRAIIKQNAIKLINLDNGAIASAQCEFGENINSLIYASFSVPSGAKMYVDNFLVAQGGKNLSAVVNGGNSTVVAQKGLVILADNCNIDPSASSVSVNGAAAAFDVTPWGGIRVNNLPKDATITVAYTLKDYNGNAVIGTATVDTINAYAFDAQDLDCYEEDGYIYATVYGEVLAEGITAKLYVAVYSNEGAILEKVGVLPITSADDDCHEIKVAFENYSEDTHTIAAFLWGEDASPIMSAYK